MTSRLALLVLASAATTEFLRAQVFTELFDYPNGELAPVSGGNWVAYNVAGSNPILVSGNSVTLAGGAAGTRYFASRSLGGSYASNVFGSPLSTGFLTYSFTLDFSAGVAPAAGSQALFLSLLDSNDNPRAQLRLLAPTSSGFRLGLEADQDQGIPTGAVTGDLSLAGIHTVTVRYNLNNPSDALTASLWVDTATSNPPTVQDTVSATLTSPITDLSLQQFTVAYSGLKIDDLTVRYTGVPEPETYAGVAGLALGAWALLRRRSK